MWNCSHCGPCHTLIRAAPPLYLEFVKFCLQKVVLANKSLKIISLDNKNLRINEEEKILIWHYCQCSFTLSIYWWYDSWLFNLRGQVWGQHDLKHFLPKDTFSLCTELNAIDCFYPKVRKIMRLYHLTFTLFKECFLNPKPKHCIALLCKYLCSRCVIHTCKHIFPLIYMYIHDIYVFLFPIKL